MRARSILAIGLGTLAAAALAQVAGAPIEPKSGGNTAANDALPANRAAPANLTEEPSAPAPNTAAPIEPKR